MPDGTIKEFFLPSCFGPAIQQSSLLVFLEHEAMSIIHNA